MRQDALPLTYDESRARFRRAAAASGCSVHERPIEAPGPDGQRLSVDLVHLGPTGPDRALVVLSGVHGVEGFVGAAAQCRLLEHVDRLELPDDVAVVLVHAVNPWGMAWWRRQNESNVDLNRNWARDDTAPPSNPGYAEVHPLLCPAGDTLPDAESFLEPIGRLVERHGIAWVRAAVSAGQYTHPDGLYFGGRRTEASTRILADEIGTRLAGARLTLSVDLHTGHGRFGEATILSDRPVGSDHDRWVRARFSAPVETTVGEDAGTSATKRGQLGHGLADVLPGAEHHSFSFEIGTVANTRMILAERVEHWVHRLGDRNDAAHAAVVWDHRCCSTPDDASWERTALAHLDRVLSEAVAAVGGRLGPSS